MEEAKEIADGMNIEPTFREVRTTRTCEPISGYLKHGTSRDIDGRELYLELLVMRVALSKAYSKPMEVLQFLLRMDGCYPNAWIAYRILLTIPVTVASAERSFSKLKLILSYLRSTMSEERLIGLSMLAIETDMVMQVDFKVILNDFASRNVRKINFQ
ncbi:uncharacterized protein LOC113361170 [Papaver somniferum]|uniref:uncharacterized protein LOC113361170 n=1 Tax=Papaver somniferum TaxID=3469 RepID=UPI000E700C90|nr:uncharacterized protein LOC113361170 [Papaver somniferum]XP_026460291.1 uncharacterized protein LOC113361170 [Papaver somniferum]